jgi:TonB family protein
VALASRLHEEAPETHMRPRDVTIPLVLWMCAAVCAHFLFGTGGLVVADMHDDRSELWMLAQEASNLAQRSEQTFELSMGDSTPDHKDDVAPPPPPKIAEAPKPEPTAAPVEKKPTPPKAKPQEKKIIVVEKKEPEKKPLIPEDMPKERRIAVRQHVKPDQDDNPTAKFIGDEANHVDKETAATQTSHDRDDENPTPGGNHPGSNPQTGDSEKTRIAESEEHAGEKNRAPGEKGPDVDVVHEPHIPKPAPAAEAAQVPPPSSQPHATMGDPRPVAVAQAPHPDEPAKAAAGGAVPLSPDVETAPNSGWTFNPVRQGGAPAAMPQASAGSATQSTLPGGKLWSLPGLGQPSSPGSMNTNIDVRQIAAIVGSDNLRKLREADGERRKSEHRGSFAASNFERWKSAIENYVSSVRAGNQTALNTARSPFASYLNGMHNRIHPIFADSFLDSLDSLPPNHPMNDQHLMTRLEIVLTKDGHLKRMGVVKTSGVTMFDIAALDSVDRAQPFGPAPSAIVSPDGNVYLHWEFHRDAMYACSTNGAWPYILNTSPTKNVEPAPPAKPASPGREQSAPPAGTDDAREGSAPAPKPRLARPPA